MSSPIPTSTSIMESAVIEAPLSRVWHLVKLQDFHKWWAKLDHSEMVKGVSEEADVVRWKFQDGTELEVKLEEHSTIDHYITYGVIASRPALSYTSVLSRIRCYPVTSGKNEGSTFVEWSATFSSDADAGVIEDARYKRREALADLANVAATKK